VPEWRDARVCDLTSLNVGWESGVYAFDLDLSGAAEPARQELVLRIYPGAYAAHKADGEFGVLRSLYEAGYPVPRVYVCECQASPFGRPFIVMERMRGRSMGELYLGADGSIKARYLELFCALFVRLHSLDWRRFVKDPAPYEGPNHLCRHSLARMRTVLVEPFDVPGLAGVLDRLEEGVEDLHRWPPSLLHWDFHANNILVDGDGAPIVLDWASAEVSDPRLDIARTLLLNQGAGAGMRAAVLEGYERLSGRRIVDLEWFETMAWWRRLASVTVSLLYGAERVGMRPGAEGMMRTHLDMLREVYRLLVDRVGVCMPEVERALAE